MNFNEITDKLSEVLNKSVNETKDVDGEYADYTFLVTVTMDAENQTNNGAIKQHIQKAIEQALEAYDCDVEVEDA